MFFKCSLILFLVISGISARIHNIQIKNDNRKFIRLSNFAFNKAGILHININNFTSHPDNQHFLFGLTLDRIPNDGLKYYLNSNPSRCIILEKIIQEKFVYDEAPILYFPFDLQNKKIKLHCSKSFNDIQITRPFISYNLNNSKTANEQDTSCSQIELPINYVLKNKTNYYNIEFTINMTTVMDEGKYNVFLHNCANYEEENNVFVDFNVKIEERNAENFLSITEINLPKIYCILALLYFLTGAYWVFILWRRRSAVLKIHTLMAIFIYLKFITILLNYIHYKYIEKIGEQSIIWSSLYYISDFFMEIFFFITIILIGSGWTIIKLNLKRKIKIILIIVIMLQITATIMKFYLHANDRDDHEYRKLKDLYLISDLLSCVLTLFPAVWTLKQLKRSSELEDDQTQTILFKKHFVLLIICIYFTRIIPYLIQLTVTDINYAWLHTLCKELTYYVCFVLIGFIFRPIIKSYLSTIISDDVNEIDSSLPIKDTFNSFNNFNEKWTSTTNIINAMDDEEESSLLSEINEQSLI